MDWIYVAIGFGAILGALSRYYLTLFSLNQWSTKFPYGTFFVNLSGCFLIGFIAKLITEHTVAIELQKFLLVGFLGSYTTFSSYILDSANLFRHRQIKEGFFYWLGSPILGFVFVELGIWLARQLLESNL